MDFHWSVSDSKSPQISRTLLSILAVLNYIVVWMVYTRPPASKSSSPFNNPLVTVPKEPITIGIIVTFMFHSLFFFFFQLPSFHFPSVLFCGQPGLQSPQFCKFSFFLFFFFFCCWLLWSSGRDLVIRLYVKVLFAPLEFFISVLADGFSLEFEWQQVSSSLQDSSQDSGRS